MKKAEKASVQEGIKEKSKKEGHRGTINKDEEVEKYMMSKFKCQ